MAALSHEEAARSAGVEPGFLDWLVELGLVTPVDGAYSAGDVRRVMLTRTLEDAGIPIDGMAAEIRRGTVSLDFLDAPAYERFAAVAPETFREVSARTGVPIELLMMVREAIGLAQPSPDDRLRGDEMAIVPFIQAQVEEGFRPSGIERLLRVYGDATRRIGEQEGAWWATEVIAPGLAAGKSLDAIADPKLADRLTPLGEQSVLAMYHAQQTRSWTANIVEGMETVLAAAGVHSRLQRPPAVCFLDITGYTRLTQEQGDDAAADLAATVANLVQRSSVQHGGQTIKWLGDGVMFYFRDPGHAPTAAIEMLEGLAGAGLPPAHVGLHAGPVLFQQGDYFGQTVNLSARIADYARAGEVLVSREAAEASRDPGVAFAEMGPVELKGVANAVNLLRAVRAPG
jgi:class 3 adenylate cyclase